MVAVHEIFAIESAEKLTAYAGLVPAAFMLSWSAYGRGMGAPATAATRERHRGRLWREHCTKYRHGHVGAVQRHLLAWVAGGIRSLADGLLSLCKMAA
jgi:hypothetical protein